MFGRVEPGEPLAPEHHPHQVRRQRLNAGDFSVHGSHSFNVIAGSGTGVPEPEAHAANTDAAGVITAGTMHRRGRPDVPGTGTLPNR
ncbi:hypothetical protein GCM10023353_36060 [Tomitella cavernea]|uniref:Uncharacterized protein n=1 Tax=Tomitella cavernea TaxID=1387982 RepID=A0ABP9D1X4_9ACTN